MLSLLSRHLRFLLKSAEDLINKQLTVAELWNEVTASKAETSAMQSQLATVAANQDLDHASAAKEKDGRLNEK
jgi:hypothetical protein